MRIKNRYRLLLLVLVPGIVAAIAGCSKLKNDNSPAAGGGVAPSSQSAPPSSNAAATPTTWKANATSLNGKEGETMTLACPPGGEPHSVWGSDIYTSDSSICTAAVHSGLITFQQGGAVTFEVRPGRSIYGASERNGVTSSAYGRWHQSFVFKTPNTEALVRAADEATPVLWNTSPGMVSFEVGKTVNFSCPAGGAGKGGTVWGTDTYTLDSSICTAAVHVGKIQSDNGGPVTIEMRPGEPSYKGSVRNGIKTNDYGQYGRSFVVK
ncbi:MAG: LCCL domain-containing protein [Pyrinomonadaceae bacterium]